jgi:hypothetical protein
MSPKSLVREHFTKQGRAHDGDWRYQAMSQACAVRSPVSLGFERNRDVTTVHLERRWEE